MPYADFNDPQTLNLYGYVRNNPLSRPDVDGHQILKKLKNWFTNGGWTDDDTEAEKTRTDRRVKVARFYADQWAKEHPRTGFDPTKYSDEQILTAFNNGAFSKTKDDPLDPLKLLGIVRVISVATQIADGHAWSKHQNEFPGWDKQKFTEKINETIKDATGSDVKQLSRGRTGYWNNQENMVVIRDPNSPDGGTAFRPTDGKAYFNNLK